MFASHCGKLTYNIAPRRPVLNNSNFKLNSKSASEYCTLLRSRDGQHTWTIIKDVVLVTLEGEGVALTQADIHDEMSVVSIGSSFDSLQIPSMLSCWKSKLGINYTSH